MTLVELLKDVKNKGITLYLKEGKLAFKAPPGAMDAALKELIVEHKADITDALKKFEDVADEEIKALERQHGDAVVTSFAQKRLWLIDKIQGRSEEYNIPMAFTLKGNLDLDALQQSLDQLVIRHEVLRTTFVEVNGDAYQKINPARPVDIKYIDLSDLSETEKGECLHQFLTNDATTTFDLSRDLMLRTSVIKVAEFEHTVLFTMHHIASDGWSAGLLTREFVSLYESILNTGSHQLPQPSLQYADFAHWQQTRMKRRISRQLNYWRSKLSSIPPLHDLPLDFTRPKQQTFNGSTFVKKIDAQLMSRIKEFCKEKDVTLFIFLHTIYALLFSRYSNETDIVIGTPTAGRTNRSTEQLMGCFLNTLVLRSDFSLDLSFNDLLLENKKAVLNAFENQDIPFEMIVEALNPERSLSYSPIFQLMFILQNNEQVELSMPGLELSPVDQTVSLIKYDLELIVAEVENGAVFNWFFNTALFKRSTIERMSQSFDYLIAQILHDASLAHSKLKILTEDQMREGILKGSDRELDSSFVTKFQQQVKRTPNSIALEFEDNSFTYATLAGRVTRLATYLHATGVRRGDIVGVYIERNEHMVIAMMALWELGAAYLPLDKSYPVARLQYMIDDSGIASILTDEEDAGLLSVEGKNVVLISKPVLDQHLDLIKPEYLIKSIQGEESLESIAYVIYTSGSTGKPKGVVVNQGNVINTLMAMSERLGITVEDSLLAVTPISFDIHVLELFLPLISGSRLVLGSTETATDGFKLLDAISKYKISIMQATPATWKMMYATGHWTDDNKIKILCGGEALERGLADKLVVRATSLWNMYGPTEATVWVSCQKISTEGQAITIGKPFQNTQFYVLSEQLDIQPRGVVGELYIGGQNVAPGYLNNADLTDERFVKNPFGKGKLYRTGDQVRINSLNDVEYIGRIDDQVKVRGYRIELGEIVAQLLKQPHVKDATVDIRETRSGNHLVAYIILDKDSAGSLSHQDANTQTYNGLKKYLADYMLPSSIVYLDHFPLTANGKIDKKSLPNAEQTNQGTQFVSPRNNIEEKLCEIWKELLGLDNVSINENFFSLGGDSILSIQFVSKAKLEKLNFSNRDIFTYQTIAELAQFIENQIEEYSSSPVISANQLSMLRTGKGEVQQLLVNLPGAFTESMFHPLMTQIIRRHDALRTIFSGNGNNWSASLKEINEELIARICNTDSVSASGINFDKFLTHHSALQDSGFVINGDLLLRTTYFPNYPQALLLEAHSLIIDAQSCYILAHEINQLSKQLISGNNKPCLIEPAPSVSTWNKVLNSYVNGDSFTEEQSSWQSIKQFTGSDLPTDNEKRELTLYQSTASKRVQLSAFQTEMLLNNCLKGYRLNSEELVLAGICTGLKLWNRQSAIRVAIRCGRKSSLVPKNQLNNFVGNVDYFCPVTVNCESNEIAPMIFAVKDAYRKMPGSGVAPAIFANGDSVADNIVLMPEISYQYRGEITQDNIESGRHIVSSNLHFASPLSVRKFKLDFDTVVTDETLQITLEYSKDQYSDKTITAIIESVVKGIDAVIEHSRTGGNYLSPTDFPLANVSEEQLKKLEKSYDIVNLYQASAMQSGLMLHSLLDSNAYICQLFPTFEGGLEIDCMRRAWEYVIARHEIFRTVFIDEGSGLQQIVCRSAQLNWNVEDWTELTPKEQDEKFNKYCIDDRNKGFDMSTPSLMRVAVFKLSDNKYKMLWTYHHILFDGWSMPFVYQDLMIVYRALVQQQTPFLPEPPKLDNYIHWLNQQNKTEAKAYWKQYLSCIEAPTPLMVDQLPVEEHGRFLTADIKLAHDEHQELIDYAKSKQVTINTLTQLAWGYLLNQYSGQSHIMFGSTISGRPPEIEDIESMIGLFINTIPVVIDFSSDCTVEDLLRTTQFSFQNSNAYGYLPLEDIRLESKINNGSDLFYSTLVFENQPFDVALAIDEKNANEQHAALAVIDVDSNMEANFPLNVTVRTRGSFQVILRYWTNFCSESAMERLLQHFKQILIQLPRQKTVKQIDIRSDQERQLMQQLNNTSVPVVDLTALKLFEHHVAQSPDISAIRAPGGELTYKQLSDKVSRLACLLIEEQIKPGQHIGVCLPNSIELVVAVFAIMKIGCVYIPMNADSTTSRLKYIIEDADIVLVLLNSESLNKLSSSGTPVLLLEKCIDENWFAEYSDSLDELPYIPTDEESLAYVIYTSGTTGQPKGVSICHRSLTNYLLFAQKEYINNSLQGAVLSTPISFDASITTLFTALISGKQLAIVSPDKEATFRELKSYLFEGSEHWLFKVTPVHLDILFSDRPDTICNSNHVIVIGGEALTKRSLALWKSQLLPNAKFVNEYGPTEATVGCSYFTIDSISDLENCNHSVSIGKPIANTELLVLRDERQVPLGAVGELYIGGQGLAREYYNKDTLTIASFINLTIDNEVKRFYRTGDFVRYLDDGHLEYIGRIDNQIKINGIRIEAEGVKKEVTQLNDVLDAFVGLLSGNDDSSKSLLVFVLCDKNIQPQRIKIIESEAREKLRECFSGNVVPSRIVVVNELLMTEHGKVDIQSMVQYYSEVKSSEYRKVQAETLIQQRLLTIWQEILKTSIDDISQRFYDLGGNSSHAIKIANRMRKELLTPNLLKAFFDNVNILELSHLIDGVMESNPRETWEEQTQVEQEAHDQEQKNYDVVALLSSTEKKVIEIWTSALKVDINSVTDNFFELGGNSSKAIIIANEAAQYFNVDSPMEALFENSTVSAFAKYIDKQVAAESCIQRVAREELHPLSFAQQRLWFIDQLNNGSAEYNMPMALKFGGEIDVEAIRFSLNTLLNRHEILRTTYHIVGGEPRQKINDFKDVPLDYYDLASENDTGSIVERRLLEETRKAFDLSKDVMVRVVILKLSASEHVVLLMMHHIASDGWSMDIFTREFVEVYRARCQGIEHQLPALEIQYVDYAHWIRNSFSDKKLEEQLQFWLPMLCDAPRMQSLPTDYIRPAKSRHISNRITQVLPAETTQQLNKLSSLHDSTLFMTLQSVLALELGLLSRSNDILIGSPISGRMHSQVEPLIGFFISTTVFRHRFSSSMTFEDLLVATRENTKKTFANQDIPFETLIDQLNVERSLSYTPLFQVVLSLQNFGMLELMLPGLVVDQVDSKESVIKYDLELSVNEINNELWINWNYDTGLFSEKTIQLMADLFRVIITELLVNPDQPLDQLNFFSRMPQDKIEEWNEKLNRQIENHGVKFDPRLAEQRIESLECVGEAFFYKRQDDEVAELLLYIRPANESVLVESDVKQFMEQELANYIAVANIVQVKEFPRNKDETIDVSRLPFYKKYSDEERLKKNIDNKKKYSTYKDHNQNNLGVALSLIWQELLGVEAIRAEDNFFDLGGNSLLAIRIVDSANKKGIPLQLGYLWKYKNFGEIAQALQREILASQNDDVQLGQESTLQSKSFDDKNIIPVTKSGYHSCRVIVNTEFTETHLRHVIKKIDAKFGVLGSELLLVDDKLSVERNKTNIKTLQKLVVVVKDMHCECDRDAAITEAANDFSSSLEYPGSMTCRVLFVGDEVKNECVLLCHQNLFAPEQWVAVSDLFEELCGNVVVV